MFDLHTVELYNFRSYKGVHTFKFPTAPGLYSLTGRNLDNPRLGTNGTGKSTLLEAIYWCLYGKTTRGLRSTDVTTWGQKGCSVSVELTIGDQTSRITRAHSPNNLELDKNPITQDDLQKFLRLSPDAFTYSVLIPQFGESFFDLAPSHKLTLFSKILELEYWLERSQIASELADEISSIKANTERRLSSFNGQLNIAITDEYQIRDFMTEFVGKQKDIILGIEGKIDQQKKDLSFRKKDISSIELVIKQADKKISSLEGQDHQTALSSLQKQLAQFASLEAVAKAALTALRGTLSRLNTLGPICPTCLQKVTSNHLQAEEKRLLGEIKLTEATIKDRTQKLNACEAEIRNLEKQHLAKERDLTALRQNKRDFERKLLMANNTISQIERTIDSLSEEISRERKKENPYANQLQAKQEQILKLKAEVSKSKADIAQLEKDHASIHYWVNGFKKVRLSLIDETLEQLDIEVNNSLTNFGLLNWRIEFDVERENKAGGITKGFVVLVYAPNSEKAVRFESWSGGETQRLRLAGDLGLSNLIMARAGLSNTIEFYDEPSSHLSEDGINDLLESLHSRAIETGKRIFLVDHHNLEFGDFEGRIVAIKDADGSHLVYE